MEDSNEGLRKALLCNTEFLAFSNATEALTQSMVFMKRIDAAGTGLAFDVNLTKRAKHFMNQGIETVSITYALFKLAKIAELPSVWQRKRDCDKLRADIKKKCVELGPSMEAYITTLTTPPKKSEDANAS